MDMKADAIINDILNHRYNAFETRGSTGPEFGNFNRGSNNQRLGATGFLKTRMFDGIPDV